MRSDTITIRQAICIIITFIIGSSVVIGGNTQAGQDSWISITIGAVCAIPAVIMYARIMHLYPEQGLFDIIQTIFGTIFGKILIALMSLYALHLGSFILRNFSEFLKITAMPETPQPAFMIVLMVVVLYLTISGVRVLGKWTTLILPTILGIVLITISLSFGQLDFSNLFPIMNHDIKDIATGSLGMFTFPFAETVVFLALASSVKKDTSPYKVYVVGLILGALIILIVFLRNLLVLGAPMSEQANFPSYKAAKMIGLGEFFQRIEGSIAINFIFSGITKITVCLLAASKGVTKLFGIKNEKKTMFPITVILTVILIASSYYTFSSIIQMYDVAFNYYKYYALAFQIVIPLIVWIGAEIKHHKEKSIENYDY